MSQHLLKTALGRALREARERTPGHAGRCLSQSAIAARVGVEDKGTIGEYERGAGGFPPDEILERWATATGTTYVAIIDRAAELIRDEIKRRGDPSTG
jgi:transcriptional regulator with XRE-family HTH domain